MVRRTTNQRAPEANQPSGRGTVTAIAGEFGVDALELLEDFEERAGVREYEGGQTRAVAERYAVEDCREIAADRARRKR